MSVYHIDILDIIVNINITYIVIQVYYRSIERFSAPLRLRYLGFAQEAGAGVQAKKETDAFEQT